MREGEARPDVASESFKTAVKFYIDKAKSLVGVKVPGFEDKNASQDYIEMVCKDIRNSAEEPDPRENPDFVKLEGVSIGDYPGLADAVEEAAKREGLI